MLLLLFAGTLHDKRDINVITSVVNIDTLATELVDLAKLVKQW